MNCILTWNFLTIEHCIVRKNHVSTVSDIWISSVICATVEITVMKNDDNQLQPVSSYNMRNASRTMTITKWRLSTSERLGIDMLPCWQHCFVCGWQHFRWPARQLMTARYPPTRVSQEHAGNITLNNNILCRHFPCNIHSLGTITCINVVLGKIIIIFCLRNKLGG